jgi:hypothetical protein
MSRAAFMADASIGGTGFPALRLLPFRADLAQSPDDDLGSDIQDDTWLLV